MSIYLLVAAVNFDATIFDSNDLSVIRGSSLTVLRFGDCLLSYLSQRFAQQAAIEPLFNGASELVVRLVPRPVARPTRPNFDAPLGANKTWRNKTLPALLGKVDTGVPIAQVASAWANEHGASRNADWKQKAERRITAQLQFLRAERQARAEAARPLPVDCAAVEGLVEAFLRAPEQRNFGHFCFASACIEPPTNTGLAHILADLYSRLRTRQLQQLTVVLPAAVEQVQAATQAFCPYTLGRQPATPGRSEKGQPISASALARRAEGREQKQRFYQAQLHRSARAAAEIGDTDASAELSRAAVLLEDKDFSFATEFAGIVADPPSALPPNVRNKLAVIFIDGNGFSDKRQRCAELHSIDQAFTAYRTFCLALERNGGLILAKLLPWMMEESAFIAAQEGNSVLRFETLLFGGDDICFVLPAWGAFAFMGKLQEILASLRAPVAGRDNPLTYKAGMVLADAKSPIRDLRNVADALGRAAKRTSGDRNIVQTVALEGIDRADLDPEHLRRDIFGPACGEDLGAFGLEGSDWTQLRATVERISATIGRSQLHNWYVRAETESILSLSVEDERVRRLVADFDARLEELQVADDLRAVLTGQRTLLASGAARWPLLPLYHVLSLADYVGALPLAEPASQVAA